MRILLVGHGRPGGVSTAPISGRDIGRWTRLYNGAGRTSGGQRRMVPRSVNFAERAPAKGRAAQGVSGHGSRIPSPTRSHPMRRPSWPRTPRSRCCWRRPRRPDPAPDPTVGRHRAGTSGGKKGEDTAVHPADAPRLRRRSAAGGVLRTEARISRVLVGVHARVQPDAEGRVTVLRQTMRQRFQAKRREVKTEVRRGLHAPIPPCRGPTCARSCRTHVVLWPAPQRPAHWSVPSSARPLWRVMSGRRSQTGSVSWARRAAWWRAGSLGPHLSSVPEPAPGAYQPGQEPDA
jgi:hypothetical protein